MLSWLCSFYFPKFIQSPGKPAAGIMPVSIPVIKSPGTYKSLIFYSTLNTGWQNKVPPLTIISKGQQVCVILGSFYSIARLFKEPLINSSSG